MEKIVKEIFESLAKANEHFAKALEHHKRAQSITTNE